MLAQGPGGQRLHQGGSRSRTCEGRWAQLVPGGTRASHQLVEPHHPV